MYRSRKEKLGMIVDGIVGAILLGLVVLIVLLIV